MPYSDNQTSIPIIKDVRNKLKDNGKKGETYSDIITRLMDMPAPQIHGEHITRKVGKSKRPYIYLPDDYVGWEVAITKIRKVE